VVETLLDGGADVHKAMTTDGSTPLYMAAQRGNLVIVTLLLANGADVNKARTIDGSTPLYVAASLGHTAIVSYLLDHGADKSIGGFQNETPLEAAQRNNYVAIIVLLTFTR
jgi:ankyrin repeat protein